MSQYRLDLEAMLEILASYHCTGILSADVPSAGAKIREPCHIEVKVTHGKVIFCTLTSRSGQHQFGGDTAFQIIARLGLIEWTLTLVKINGAPQQPLIPVAPSIRIPRRLMMLDPSQLVSWPRQHRSVYSLVNGSNSIERIAHICAVSPQAVEQVLRDLQLIQVITME